MPYVDHTRMCPECNLVFEAEQPSSGVLTCPVCNTVFSAASFPSDTAPRNASGSSGRQVFRGCLAIGALILLGGSLVYAYRLMNGLEHQTAVHSPPPDAPRETSEAQAPESDFGPVQIIPNTFVPLSPPPRREPIAEAPKPSPPAPKAPPRPQSLAERVNRAIDRGLAYLRREHSGINQYRNYLGLLGLTLLECGVPAEDPAVVQIAALLRKRRTDLIKTYELALAILFFDRLGDSRDKAIIRTFGDRLLVGHLAGCTWTYDCSWSYSDHIRYVRSKSWGKDIFGGDNSNTQFALVGLWVAQRHGVEARDAFRSTAAYYEQTQLIDGSWGYYPVHLGSRLWRHSMTCTGLMSLAMRYGVNHLRGNDIRPDERMQVSDGAMLRGLRYLDGSLGGVTFAGKDIVGVDARGALYFLWSLERMAVIYDLKRIGEREWYPWAAEMLVETQRDDDCWSQGFPAAIDTCFALLVLKRSNYSPDLKLAVPDNLPLVLRKPPPRRKPSLDFQTRSRGPTILQGREEIFESIAEKNQRKKSKEVEPLTGIPTTPSKKQ